MFFGSNGIKIEISKRKLCGKSPNVWKLNDTFLNNSWAKEEIKWEIWNYFEMNERKTITSKFVRCS